MLNRISFYCIVLIFISIGLNLEYSSDSFFAASYKGILNDESIQTFYIYMLYWDNLLVALYDMFPDFSWYGFLLLLYQIPTIFLVDKISKRVLNKIDFSIRLLFTTIIAVIVGLSFFYIGFTRIPFFISGVVWLYVCIMPNRRWIIDVLLAIYLAGACFMRYESMLASIIFLLPSLLFIYRYSQKSFLLVCRKLILIYSIGFLGVLVHHQIYNNSSDRLAREFYKAHFNFFDASQRKIPENKYDSIRIKAMSMDFNADKDSLNIEVYKGLTIGNALKINRAEQLNTKWSAFKDGVNNMYYDNHATIYFFSLLTLCVLLSCYRRLGLMVVLFINILSACMMILGVIFFLKYAERVIHPMLILMLIPNLICLYFSNPKFSLLKNRIIYICSFVFVLFFVYFVFLTFKTKHQEVEKICIDNYSTMRNLSQLHQAQSKDIIFTNDAMELFVTGLLNEWKRKDLVVYSFDTHINYLPGGEEGLLKYCGKKDLIGFYDFLSKKEENHVVVTSEERMNVLKDYLSIMYSYHLNIENVDSLYGSIIENEHYPLSLFKMSK